MPVTIDDVALDAEHVLVVRNQELQGEQIVGIGLVR